MRVKAVFSKLVSPEVVQELLRLERFSLGGARRQITVFFADVRGFTEMTDRRQAAAEEYVKSRGLEGEAAEAYYEQEAKEVLDTVNRYLSAIAEVVKQHNGTLDKYIGDCVMAFWGAPAPDPKHAVHAVQAAVDAQRAIHELNLVRAQEHEARQTINVGRVQAGLPPLPPVEQLALGTGVNTGTMMVGLMGSEDHTLNYTAFGREVNLASRLEGVSGRSRIIIGEATYRELLVHAPEIAALCVMRDSVQVKGFRGAVTNYEVQWKMEAEGNTVALRRPFSRMGRK
jgi:adenylate cyclase